MVILCPPLDDVPWPTLGPDVCAFIEEYMCHGPGDLLGEPVKLNDEQRAWLYRMYEVHPPTIEVRKNKVISKSANPRAGRRRFQRCALSLRKGSAKTEFAAWVAGVEAHSEGPVRCAGFQAVRGEQVPIPRAVDDPYIPMISYSEEQTEELAYGALRRILEESSAGRDFDIGLERIMRRNGKGKVVAVSASPNARDGARTTFQHADETHRFTLDSLKRGWRTMLANLPKRPLADPWALETTTAPEPGAGSVAESTMAYATKVIDGEVQDPRLFFFHRQASDDLDITTEDGLRVAVEEASGPFIGPWTDVDRIISTFGEPDADLPYLERVWTNRQPQASGRAFDIVRWRELVRADYVVKKGARIALGFDGSLFDDATGIIGTELETGFQWRVGVWEKPAHAKEWQVEESRVDGVVRESFQQWRVVLMYCDPFRWESWVSEWSGRYGKKRVIEWWTNRPKQMAYAIRSYTGAIRAGALSHDGDARFDEHIANAHREPTNLLDDQKKPLWIIRKQRPDSPKKIDLAMAGILSWEARNDAIAEGKGRVVEKWSL